MAVIELQFLTDIPGYLLLTGVFAVSALVLQFVLAMRSPQLRRTRVFTLVVVFTALGVVLSPYLWYPIGPTRAFPGQHMVNVLTGVLLGPILAPLVAIYIGVIRILLGVGTIFAFPGGIPGSLFVGLAYRYLKSEKSAFFEPFGTSLGAVLSVAFLYPFLGVLGAERFPLPPQILGFAEAVVGGIGVIDATYLALVISWLPSTLSGTVLGYLIIKALRRTGVFERAEA